MEILGAGGRGEISTNSFWPNGIRAFRAVTVYEREIRSFIHSRQREQHVKGQAEWRTFCSSVASDQHSGTIDIIVIYVVSPVHLLTSPSMDSDCCLLVELCCDYWGFSFSCNHLSWGQENCHFGPLPLLPPALLLSASSAQSSEAILVWDSDSEGQELHNTQELLG